MPFRTNVMNAGPLQRHRERKAVMKFKLELNWRKRAGKRGEKNRGEKGRMVTLRLWMNKKRALMNYLISVGSLAFTHGGVWNTKRG